MEIKYDFKEEDYVEFNIHHMKSFKTGKRMTTMLRWIGPILFLMSGLVMGSKEFLGFNISFFLYITLALLWYFLYPKIFMNSVRKRVKKLLKEGKNKGLLGQRTIKFDDQGYTSISSVTEAKTIWSAVERVDQEDNYIYIFESAVSAVVIPLRELSETEVCDVKKILKENAVKV